MRSIQDIAADVIAHPTLAEQALAKANEEAMMWANTKRAEAAEIRRVVAERYERLFGADLAYANNLERQAVEHEKEANGYAAEATAIYKDRLEAALRKEQGPPVGRGNRSR